MLHHDRCMINIHKKIHQKIKRNKKHTIVHFLIVSNLSTRKQLYFFFKHFHLNFETKISWHTLKWWKNFSRVFHNAETSVIKEKKLNKRKKLWNFFAIKNIPSMSILILIFVVIHNQKYWLCRVLKYRFIFLRI